MSNLHLTQEKLDALRSEYKPRRPCALLKYPRPKTKPEYLSLYPWLILDETDPHFVFCVICECRLSAKRSDLGKHECSIKHSENAQRKAVPPGTAKWEYNDSIEGMYDAAENVCKTELESEEEEVEGDEVDDDDADEHKQGTEADGDADGENEYEPSAKRSNSETDSQHSGLDYLPVQVTINELPVPHTTANATLPLPASANPCRITIKKVTTPLTKVLATSSTSANAQEITSKATITPIATGFNAATQRQSLPYSYAAQQLQSYQLQQLSAMEQPPRDSLELFFDSICATVKSLPPKLATEGKIRVMQLIGELELRAIGEREEQPSVQPSTVGQASPVAVVAAIPASSQQNATVASTTK
ncbi:Ravus [Drosophila busckii]|uniref:Ravus n=1 Tax=Drosophila busckii TaxID=30019 RepID=A0A0M4EP68_DROBS|nr:protein suppressor of variegation 3-7 [Drosophila busckii]XP_017845452.1 protein suppressor of variegation 3-7 [Drosophila busckii]ALC47540.1 Ravus [Drosophila busckii]